MYRAVDFLMLAGPRGPSLQRIYDTRQGKVLIKHYKADGVFFYFFIRDAPGKRLEVDLVYPNIYIDMLFFSLSALLMNRVHIYRYYFQLNQISDWIGYVNTSKGPP